MFGAAAFAIKLARCVSWKEFYFYVGRFIVETNFIVIATRTLQSSINKGVILTKYPSIPLIV